MKALSDYKSDMGSIRAPHLILKPAGPSCNLQCKYCYYAEKSALFNEDPTSRMSPEVLTRVVERHFEFPGDGPVMFDWQGGEPLLAGLDTYQAAVAQQKKLGRGRAIRNLIQTNGTLIDEQWAEFFAEEKFEVSISLDGPEKFHDRYRLRKCGGGSFAEVMRGIDFLKAAGVPFSTVTAIHRGNENHPLEVYSFLRELGAERLSFVPVVEREANQRARDLGLNLATPPPLRRNLKCQPRVSSWSVTPPGFGRFMVEIFERWVRTDVDRVTISEIEDTWARYQGQEGEICLFSKTCGDQMAVERDGSVYACDHFVYPLFRLGSILQSDMLTLGQNPEQIKFGQAKQKDLPAQCRRCTFLFACNGGCPKHRFARTTEGDPGLNYLCSAYKQMFQHCDPYFQLMRRLIERQKERSEIMEILDRIPRAVGY